MRTKWHIHTPIDYLLGLSDKRLMELVTHPEGAQGVRNDLRNMLADGKTCLVAGPCDHQKPDGTCAGHPSSEED